MVRVDIDQHVEALRREFLQAASAMGPELESAAERLGFALDSSARLTLMDALSQAAAEITTELDGRSVEVRLEGREPVLVVRGSGPAVAVDDATTFPDSESTALPLDDEGAETARITLRLPESLKVRAEELATGRGQSLNTWIVGAVRLSAMPGTTGSTVTIGGAFGPGAPGRTRFSNKRVQGWVK